MFHVPGKYALFHLILPAILWEKNIITSFYIFFFFFNSDEAQKSNLAKDTQLPGTEVKIQTWVGYHKNMGS